MFSIINHCPEQQPHACDNSSQQYLATNRLSAMAYLVLLFALLFSSTINAQGTTDGVCSRTQQVRDELVELSGADDCASVTAADLAAITTLDLDNTGITSFQRTDFDGLTSLVFLHLRDNELTLSSFPPGLLKSLPLSIKYIDVSGNPGCPTHGEACFPPVPTLDVTVGTDTSGRTLARTNEPVKLSLNDGGYQDPLGRSLFDPVWDQTSGTEATMATTSDGWSASFIVPHITADENAEFTLTVRPYFRSNPNNRPWAQTVLNNFWKTATAKTNLTFSPALPSSDTSLAKLKIYDVTPRYDSLTQTYELTVPNSTASVTVRAEPRERRAVVEISPADFRPGAAGHQVSLQPGTNSISITITATDTVTTQTYTVTVTRDESTGVCGRTQQVRDELVELSGADDCASVTATDLAAITTLDLDNTGITSLKAFDFEGLTSLVFLHLRDNELTLDTFPGGFFHSLPLSTQYIDVSGNPGCPTHGEACFPPVPTLDVTVGTDTSGRTLARTNEPVKLSLNDGGYQDPLGRSLFDPVWDQTSGTQATMATASDGWSVSFFVPQVMADENAEFTLTTRPYFRSNPNNRPWAQTVLNNFWKTTTAKTDLTFSPPLSTVVTLSGLTLKDEGNNTIALTPSFVSTTNTYMAVVSDTTDTVTLTATKTDANATVAITNDDDTSTVAIAMLGLKAGSNTLTVTVTAEDTRFIGTYTVAVLRLETPSMDASLKTLLVKTVPGSQTVTLSPTFIPSQSVEAISNAANRTFTGTVSHDTDKVSIDVTTTAANARVVIERYGSPLLDTDENSTRAVSSVDLEYGKTNLRIVVTPNDPSWWKVHHLRIIRPRPPDVLNASFIELEPIEGPKGRLTHRVELELTENILMSASELKNHTLDVTGGFVRSATRVAGTTQVIDGKRVKYTRRWRISVTPHNTGPVTISVAGNRDCTLDGALCTLDGIQLANSPSIILDQSEALAVSVAPGTTGDEDDGVIYFTLSLSRAALKPVVVRFRTIDSGANTGTATANADYRPLDGERTFWPGDTTLEQGVAIIDDAINDNNETVAVEISNARMFIKYPLNRTKSRAVDMTAPTRVTGTITNTDPLPQAWLVRFGRTVAEQILEAVNTRLDSNPTAPHFTLGGVNFNDKSTPATAVLTPQDWLATQFALEPNAQRPEKERTLSGRELLLSSSFHLVSTAEESDGPIVSAWGRVSTSGFQAQESEVAMDGEVTTALLGFDAEWERLLAGLILARSQGDGAYSLNDGSRGTLESTLTGVYPYAQLTLGARVSVWGMAGIGGGNLSMRWQNDLVDTRLGLSLGAAGIKSSLLTNNVFDLTVKSDALWVRTHNDAATGLAATSAQVNRIRLILEAGRTFTSAAGAVLTPTALVGLRHDGGDAETGTGIEVGAGIRYTTGVLSIEGQIRTLLAHQSDGYKKWSASGTIRLSPKTSGLGPSLAVLPSWGTASNGLARLWSQRDASALIHDGPVAGRLNVEFGYGLPALHGRGVLTPYARAALAEGRNQSWHLGTRLTLNPSLNLSLEGSHRDTGHDTTHDLAFNLTLPW